MATLQGTDGNDLLAGTAEADQLAGAAGNDAIDGFAGDDLLEGGSGQDALAGGSGADTLRGGDGDDLLADADGSQMEGGAGRDSFVLSPGSLQVLADFAAGASGDRLALQAVLAASSGYEGGNPFAEAAFLRLQADGADTLLQWDADGAAGAEAGWLTLARLQGVAPSALVPENFVPAMAPDGGSSALAITGSSSADLLQGSVDGDTLSGAGGSDTLAGWGGDDLLDGGGGRDILAGGAGNDTLAGGTDLQGNDLAGNEGDDSLTGSSGNDVLAGGTGADTLAGGAGADVIGDLDAATVLAGDGDDLVAVPTGEATGGAGRDTYVGFTGLAITDFAAGAGGDLLDLRPLLAASPGAGEGNPFGSLGYLRLQAAGSDTELQWDADGAAGTAHAWVTMAVLRGLAPASLTGDNFLPWAAPDGSAQGLLLAGTAGDDLLAGSVDADQADGGEGADTIEGYGGADTLAGGAGDDLLHGGDGSDSLAGGDGADLLAGGLGDDVLDGGEGEDTLADLDGMVTLTGGGGADVFVLGAEVQATLADFAAGVDSLDLQALLDAAAQQAPLQGIAAVAGRSFAPAGDLFASGHLRLLQEGVDTLLQWDPDGTASGATFRTLARLQGVQATSLAAGDFLQPMAPQVLPAVFTGSDGADRLAGTGADDTLDGARGADTLAGGAGDDLLAGGSGRDVADFATALQAVVADLALGTAIGQGNDRLVDVEGVWGSAFSDVLAGDGLANLLRGEAGRDTLQGGAGDDTLLGGLEKDVLAGGDGADLLDGGRANDRLDGGAGNDLLLGAHGRDLMAGGAGDDSLDGGQDADRLAGGDGADSLAGGKGDDLLEGEAGDDRLEGGGGTDLLAGGAGADAFVFGDAGGLDRVQDFVQVEGDRLHIAAGINGSAIADAADALAAASQDGADVVLDLGGGHAVRLVGVALESLDTGAFVVG